MNVSNCNLENFYVISAIACAAAGSAIALIANSKKYKRKQRRMHVNPYLRERKNKGRFATAVSC